MLIGCMVLSHLLNDYATKTMANEDQWTIFCILFLLNFKDLYRNFVAEASNHLFTFIVQSRE